MMPRVYSGQPCYLSRGYGLGCPTRWKKEALAVGSLFGFFYYFFLYNILCSINGHVSIVQMYINNFTLFYNFGPK